MANLRVIFDNVADDATSLAADSTAGAYAASLMQDDLKGNFHRSVGTSVTYSLSWAAGVTIGALGLPGHNLSSTATQRLRLYSDTAWTTLLVDSGTGYACPGLNLSLWKWKRPLNGNAFAYGGLAKSAIWLGAHYFAKSAKIDLVDVDNTAGAIDCARLVLGSVFEPAYNPPYGVLVTPMDTTQHTRNDAGDDRPDLGTRHDEMTLDLKFMPEDDRAELMRIYQMNGTARNMFWSLLPGNVNPLAEQQGMLYAHRENDGISFDMPLAFSNRVDLKGW